MMKVGVNECIEHESEAGRAASVSRSANFSFFGLRARSAACRPLCVRRCDLRTIHRDATLRLRATVFHVT